MDACLWGWDVLCLESVFVCGEFESVIAPYIIPPLGGGIFKLSSELDGAVVQDRGDNAGDGGVVFPMVLDEVFFEVCNFVGVWVNGGNDGAEAAEACVFVSGFVV